MMKITHTICLSLLLLLGCKQNADHHEVSVNDRSNVVITNEFVDAFYSFDGDSLGSKLSLSKESKPNILLSKMG